MTSAPRGRRQPLVGSLRQGTQRSASGVRTSSWLGSACPLADEEGDGHSDLLWDGQRLTRRARAGPTRRLDAGIDDQQGDLDALLAELQCRGVGDRPHTKRARRPQTAAGHGASGGAASDLDDRGRSPLVAQEPAGGRQEREGGAGGATLGGRPDITVLLLPRDLGRLDIRAGATVDAEFPSDSLCVFRLTGA
jgi:hypothetical protein